MSKDSKSPNEPTTTTANYGDVVHRLEDVVKRLEGGDLSLEDSLKAFEEGIGLVRRGERLLGDAEKRVEQLLSEDGEPKSAPLDLAPNGSQPRDRVAGKPAASVAKPDPGAEGEDVPF